MTVSSTNRGTRGEAFLPALADLPVGCSQGRSLGERWGVMLQRAAGQVSFNLYLISARARLKPCEMPWQTDTRFLAGVRPDKER